MSETQSVTIPGPEATTTLREITRDTLRPILRMDVAESQRHFVAPNAVSVAQAHFAPEAWFRAIYADETPVGFVMLSEDADEGEYFLWRLMIDAHHQGKGYGRQAVQLLIEHVRMRPKAKELLVSHVPGEGSPAGFYQKLGFNYTGEEDDGELVMKLTL